MNKKQKKIQKIFNTTRVLLFLIFIFLPLLSKIFPIEPGIELQEKRMPAERPKIRFSFPELLRYPDEFERYHKDNFGFRSSFVFLFNKIRSRFTGLIVGKNVLVGKHGWYFVTQDKTIDDFRGAIKLSPSQLGKIKDTLEDRKEWLSMFGIKYLLVIAPAKWEIYPEMLPDNISRISEQTVLDQIIALLQDQGNIDLLDLRKPLQKLKSSYPVYYRNDTHWNSIGLFVAVQEIKKKLSEWFPEITADSLEAYNIEEELIYSGDLAVMMGLHGRIPQTKYKLLEKNGEIYPPQIPPLINPIGQTLICDESSQKQSGVRAVIFHDSFGRSFHLYMKNSFLRSAYSWRHIPDTKLIFQERPEVVVQELGQRKIEDTLSQNPPGIVGPHSELAGKRATFLCPITYRLASFKAKALLGLPVQQYLSLYCNGRKIQEWPLTVEEEQYSVPEHTIPSDQNGFAYSFSFRYEPSLAPNFEEKHALPFDLRVICRRNRSFIGINGSEFSGSDGYNVYLINPEGHVSLVQTFDYAESGKQSSAMAQFIQKTRDQKGFLILVSRNQSGSRLTREAERALRSIGLRSFPKDQRYWSHIALVDLESNRVIAERSGMAPQRLVVGNYRLKAGFRIRSLQMSKNSD